MWLGLGNYRQPEELQRVGNKHEFNRVTPFTNEVYYWRFLIPINQTKFNEKRHPNQQYPIGWIKSTIEN